MQGTDNEAFLADPLYLGIRSKRPSDEQARFYHPYVHRLTNFPI
jgi:hypothetical protein